MMRALSVAVCTLGLAAVLSAAEEKKDKNPIQGTWKRTGGNPGMSELKLDGDKFSLKGKGPGGNELLITGTFKVQADKSPKAIDMKVLKDPMGKYEGKTALGIYKIEKGKLTWCSNEPGKEERPTEFKSDGNLLVEFEKKAKEKK